MQLYQKKYLSGLQANEHQVLISRIWLRNDWCTLIDSELPHLIAKLQKRKIKVIALTAVSTGDFGVIQSLPDWRIRDLKNLKIDFSLAFPDTHHLILNQEAFAWNVPAFKAGVLFSSPYPKGLVLKEFLNAMNYKPKQVIFIDDYLANVESVAQALESMSIPYLGLHYLGAEIVPIEYDEAVAELQYRYLREKETWLSDQEAKELLVD